MCSPSRACLLTGRYPVRAGVPGNCASQQGGKGALPDTEVTLAEMFKAAGYATAHIGKWHLGYTPETQPNAQGFDHSFGHMGGCIDNYSHFFYWSGPNIHDLHRNGVEVFCDGEYFPDLMVREAAGFLEENKDRPFFIYYALNTPHYPYQGDAKWLKHFKHLPYPRNLYAAFLAAQDERLGAAAGQGRRAGTAGAHDHRLPERQRAFHRGAGALSAAAAPGPIAARNSACSRAASACRRSSRGRGICRRSETREAAGPRRRLAAHAGGIVRPRTACRSTRRPEPGDDAARPERAQPARGRALHWQVGQGPDADWAVREGDWKLIGNTRDTGTGDGKSKRVSLFLANLRDDPGETTDLADKHPDIVARLHRLHEQHLE